MSKLRIILVQDSGSITRPMKTIEKKVNQSKPECLEVTYFDYGFDEGYASKAAYLDKYLDKHAHTDKEIPNIFMLDNGGAGSDMGIKIIEWFKQFRPNAEPPKIYIASMAQNASVRAAAVVTNRFPNNQAGYICYDEFAKACHDLTGECDYNYDIPGTDIFRRLLNEHLGLNIDLKVSKNYQDRYERQFKDFTESLTPYEKWQKSVIPAQSALEQMRGNIDVRAKSIIDGLTKLKDAECDHSFFTSAGTPAKGKAVFSLEDVNNWSDPNEKPVLIMQSYSPLVVPYLSTGKLAGIVVTGQYLAAHLSFLCNANKVAGVFALNTDVQDDNLSTTFDEMSGKQLEPFFAPKNEGGQDYVVINDQKIFHGQDVLVGVGNNGLIHDAEKITKTTQNDSASDIEEQNLISEEEHKSILDVARAVCRETSTQHHIVKANVDCAQNPLLELAPGIGLVRTEQLTASDEIAANALKTVLLSNDDAAVKQALETLSDQTGKQILDLMDNVDPYSSKRVRLYDLSPKEFLTPEEQDQFFAKYGTLDIKGGDALRTWPELYRSQVQTILHVDQMQMSMTNIGSKIEIMMPSVKTKEDVALIKNIVHEETQNILSTVWGIKNFGVMIETNEAVENRKEILPLCDFVSFGTNDLSQASHGILRDDIPMRRRFQQEHGYDLFKKLTPEVKAKIKAVCDEIETIRKEKHISISADSCGEHAANFEEAMALFELGVNNISVAPTVQNLVALPILISLALADQSILKKEQKLKQEAEAELAKRKKSFKFF